MDANYKFINLVDPTKCSAKIKEKFSKLTLSSNKKKPNEADMPQNIRDQVVTKRVSRNLLSDLFTDDESDQEPERDVKCTANLLTRTDSSSVTNGAELSKPHDATDMTHCSQIEQEPDKSLEMEPLIVSCMDNTEQIEGEIEKLSTRVSSLTVGQNLPFTISSETNIHEVSRIVSTEHQRMGSVQVCSPVRLRAEMKREPDISICISSTTEEEVDNESDTPITISDSSSEDEEEEQPQRRQRRNYNEEVEPNVSSIIVAPSSSQTISTAKANQMAAFLRDVRRNYGLPTETPDRDFQRRQQEIATADTEPMTTENDSRSAGTAHRIATADTESMTEETEKDQEPSPHRRLALDETEDNTKLEESICNSHHYNPIVKVAPTLLDDSLRKSSEPIPDDSLTIAETSVEEEQSEPEETPQTSSALKRSESLSQTRSRNTSSMSSGDTQVQINISAKINIKIQVSSQQIDDSSSSEFLTDSNHSTDKSKSTNESLEEQNTHGSAHKALNNQSRGFEEIPPHSPPERDIPDSEVPVTPAAGDFIDKAQQLLNELYGDEWRTPQVLRSLKKVPATNSTKRLPRPLPVTTKKKTPVKEVEAGKGHISNKEKQERTKSVLEQTDESVLGDFSIFRRNIPQDLDSTRLPLFKAPNEMTPIPKTKRKQQKPIPQQNNAEPVEVKKTRSGREVRQNWRNIIDSDTESEGENASGDSERSWEKSSEKQDEVESDFEEIENKNPRTNRGRKKPNVSSRSKNDDKLVYLDLSKDQVEIQHNVSASPPANTDETFKNRLEDILRTCKYVDKPKLATPGSKPKRKLFSAQVEEDFDNVVAPCDTPKAAKSGNSDDDVISISGTRLPEKFEPFNKYLESVKTGKPIFKIQTPKANRDNKSSGSLETPTRTPKSAKKELRVIEDISKTPRDKYGFLKSLDLCVGKSHCHPDALYYRDNFRQKKEELATKLYGIYNEKCFNNAIDVPLVWNKKLTNTAGRCMNKKRLGERTCVVELSDKVLTSADRLRCTLIHELCHAATWILNGESGHGATWKAWARKANHIFPELPKIGVCHQYDIEYKYTYKCTLCGAKSYAHSKSKKVENIRCSYCHGAIEVYLNKKDKDGNTMMTPVKEATGFAKFVKDKYKEFKRPDLKHADVMKLLSNEFAAMKVDGKA